MSTTRTCGCFGCFLGPLPSSEKLYLVKCGKVEREKEKEERGKRERGKITEAAAFLKPRKIK